MANRKKTRRAVPRRQFANRNVRPWTREEIAFMRKYYRKFETSWIARQLGRTVYSVRYKAVDLSLKKANPSIWRGNVGGNNAFRPTKGRTTTWKPTRKATTRRTTKTRSWKACAPKTRQSNRRNNRRRTRR